jgi:hypothetical protein
MTTLTRDTAADELIKTLHEDLSRQPASAQLDAVLCLLEAARLVLRTVDRTRGEDLDHIRATMRAASLSVRSYLWQRGDSGPVARE